jgi:hypothetical protein
MSKRKEKTEKESKEDKLAKYNALQALSVSEGGIIVKNAIIKDILREIEKLSNNYSVYSLQEFISIGASLKANLTLYNTLKNAKDNAEGANEELKAYLEQNPDTE